MTTTEPEHRGPALTLVTTVRRTGDEFDRFLASLSEQPGLDAVEVCFVTVGETVLPDEVARDAATAGVAARVIESGFADVSAARRLGIAEATGRWLTFPDGQDALGPDYLSSLLTAIDEHGDTVSAFRLGAAQLGRVSHAATRPAELVDADEMLTDVSSDITRMAFPRRDVPSEGIALTDTTDELLMIDLLSGEVAPAKIGVLHGALYRRRKRVQPDPQTEFLRSSASHYLTFADGVRQRIAGDDTNTGWRHQLTLRAVKRLIAFETATTRRSTTLHAVLGESFRRELGAVLREFDPQMFVRPDAEESFDERRDTLLALTGETGASPFVHVIRTDTAEGLMEVRQSLWGDAVPEFRFDGTAVTPTYAKRRVIECFGAPLFEQVIAWVPASGRVSVHVDGAELGVRHPDGSPLDPADDVSTIADWRAQRNDDRQGQTGGASRRGGSLRGRLKRAKKAARRSWLSRAAAARLLARMPWVQREFRDAWLLMDRADMGRDNAEHMYRWLAQHHPEINAWYVLRADSPDFARLSAEGFRMVEYGSLRHQLLLNNTKQYLSSHVGIDVSRPIFDRYLQKNAPWTFTFLQHGVIHNDLSTWLNRQAIRTFLTSTHDEYGSLSGSSPYVFTTREMKLTGLPRFDKLRRIADASPHEERKAIVIAPTWRNSLFLPPSRPGERRQPRPGFTETPFIRSLLSMLNDPRLKALSDQGFVVKFVPHPNLAEHFPYGDVPSFISVTSYAENDVQELIGTAAVFLTDYSSVAFDAAFADASVVYMHLDGGAIYGQDHTLFPGYFDFERDGFGPVCHTIDETMEAVQDAVTGNRVADYRERAREAFAYWDSGACQRVYETVVSVSHSNRSASTLPST